MKQALTKKEHEMLLYIQQHNITDTTLTALAKQMNIDLGNASRRLSQLQNKGHIIRSGTLIQLLKE